MSSHTTSIIFFAFLYVIVSGQSYEDKRCRCICPSTSAVLNRTGSKERKLYIGNVPPNQCNCDGVILPRVGDVIKGREMEYCPRCDCKYESRNTTIIKVVVIMVLWVVGLLFVYWTFVSCLYSLTQKRTERESSVGEMESLLNNDNTANGFLMDSEDSNDCYEGDDDCDDEDCLYARA